MRGDIVHYLYQPGKGYFNCDEVGVIEWKNAGFYLNSRFQAWLVSVPGANSPELWEVIGRTTSLASCNGYYVNQMFSSEGQRFLSLIPSATFDLEPKLAQMPSGEISA